MKEKSTPKETAPLGPKDLEVDKEVPPGFDSKSTFDPGFGSQDPKGF